MKCICKHSMEFITITLIKFYIKINNLANVSNSLIALLVPKAVKAIYRWQFVSLQCFKMIKLACVRTSLVSNLVMASDYNGFYSSHRIPSSLLVPSMPDRSYIICVKCSGRCDTEAGVYTSPRYIQCKAEMSEVFTLLCCRSLSSFTELRFQCPYQPWAEKPNRKPDYFFWLATQ